MKAVDKFFNTAGPIRSDIHYNVNPLSRIDLDELENLIRQQKYFILHAPRQTGKTSCLIALRDYLNMQGEYIAVSHAKQYRARGASISRTEGAYRVSEANQPARRRNSL